MQSATEYCEYVYDASGCKKSNWKIQVAASQDLDDLRAFSKRHSTAKTNTKTIENQTTMTTVVVTLSRTRLTITTPLQSVNQTTSKHTGSGTV